MGTSASTQQNRQGPRVRASGRGAAGGSREQEYDLLTAALLGLAIGAGAVYLFGRGPSGRPVARVVGGAAMAGAKLVGRRERGMLERAAERAHVDPRALKRRMRRARRQIDDVVAQEVAALRKAVRRQRRRIGV